MLICTVDFATGRVTIPTWYDDAIDQIEEEIFELRQRLLTWMPNEEDRAQLLKFSAGSSS